MAFDGIILAAGNQKRFNNVTNKALVNIDDITLLEKNISVMKKYVNNIYVVCQKQSIEIFNNILKNISGVNVIGIDSGYGCGDAVIQSLLSISGSSDIILTWGDSFQLNEDIYLNSIKNYNNKFIVPLRFTDKCYVKFNVLRNNIIGVIFDKYKEITMPIGYQDCSFFMFNKEYILKYLHKLHNLKYDNLLNKYIDRGGELLFLDVINFTDILATYFNISIENNSFNTLEELENIIKRSKI